VTVPVPGSLQGLPAQELEDYLGRLWRALRAGGPDSPADPAIVRALAGVLAEMDYREALAELGEDQARRDRISTAARQRAAGTFPAVVGGEQDQ
jgi:hypothetical protein